MDQEIEHVSPELPGPFKTGLSDTSVLALAELLVRNYDDFRNYNYSTDVENVKLAIVDAWSQSSLPCPLFAYRNPNPVVSMRDVMSFLEYQTRRYSEGGIIKDNSNASKNRRQLSELIESSREKNRLDLAAGQQPAVARAIKEHYSSKRPLLDCFAKEDAEFVDGEPPFHEAPDGPPARIPTYEEAKESKGDFDAWLAARKRIWKPEGLRERQKLRAKRVKERAATEVPDLGSVKPWKEVHPETGQLYLPSVKAAQLRHMQVELHMPQSSVSAMVGMSYSFLTGEPIPEEMVVSTDTYSIATQQLAERDREDLKDKISTLLDEKKSALVHLETDDTHFKGERHQVVLSMWSLALNRPAFFLVSLSITPMKTAESNANENSIHLSSLGVPPDRDGGGSGDRPGLVEFDDKKGKVPDEWHTHALFHKYDRHSRSLIQSIDHQKLAICLSDCSQETIRHSNNPWF